MSVRHPRQGNNKYCFHCQQYKDVSLFGSNKARSDGLQQVCKECTTEYNRDYLRNYYEKHKQVISDRKKKRYHEHKGISPNTQEP